MLPPPQGIYVLKHVAQIAKDSYPLPLGAGETMGDEYIQLF